MREISGIVRVRSWMIAFLCCVLIGIPGSQGVIARQSGDAGIVVTPEQLDCGESGGFRVKMLANRDLYWEIWVLTGDSRELVYETTTSEASRYTQWANTGYLEFEVVAYEIADPGTAVFSNVYDLFCDYQDPDIPPAPSFTVDGVNVTCGDPGGFGFNYSGNREFRWDVYILEGDGSTPGGSVVGQAGQFTDLRPIWGNLSVDVYATEVDPNIPASTMLVLPIRFDCPAKPEIPTETETPPATEPEVPTETETPSPTVTETPTATETEAPTETAIPTATSAPVDTEVPTQTPVQIQTPIPTQVVDNPSPPDPTTPTPFPTQSVLLPSPPPVAETPIPDPTNPSPVPPDPIVVQEPTTAVITLVVPEPVGGVWVTPTPAAIPGAVLLPTGFLYSVPDITLVPVAAPGAQPGDLVRVWVESADFLRQPTWIAVQVPDYRKPIKFKYRQETFLYGMVFQAMNPHGNILIVAMDEPIIPESKGMEIEVKLDPDTDSDRDRLINLLGQQVDWSYLGANQDSDVPLGSSTALVGSLGPGTSFQMPEMPPGLYSMTIRDTEGIVVEVIVNVGVDQSGFYEVQRTSDGKWEVVKSDRTVSQLPETGVGSDSAWSLTVLGLAVVGAGAFGIGIRRSRAEV